MTTPHKQLRRIPAQGQIAGVCAGLADYFELDVTLVRIIFIILAIVTGGGMVIAYIIMAIVMPTDKEATEGHTSNLGEHTKDLRAELSDPTRSGRARNYLGIGIILIGLWLLLSQLFPSWIAMRWELLWPVVLIGIGFMIALRRKE